MLRRDRREGGDQTRVLVVGLGNPGKQYARTRHNVGQDAVELLASRWSETLSPGRQRARIAETRRGATPVILAVPTTYMNDSGHAVGALARRFGIDDPARIIVCHDELDLPPGTVKVKAGGGLAGHNGLRSISRHLRTDDYLRVRIGVGKPPSKEEGADHVLSRLSGSDADVLAGSVERAADAVEAILDEGLSAAMNRINAR
jgi:PTH1 family peptidyl-tRNA hydrolase